MLDIGSRLFYFHYGWWAIIASQDCLAIRGFV